MGARDSSLKQTPLLKVVLGLERLTLVAVKVMFADGAAPTLLISLPSLEYLLSLSELVEEVEQDETVASTKDTPDDDLLSPFVVSECSAVASFAPNTILDVFELRGYFFMSIAGGQLPTSN